jgi:hypothetical protein
MPRQAAGLGGFFCAPSLSLILCHFAGCRLASATGPVPYAPSARTDVAILDADPTP